MQLKNTLLFLSYDIFLYIVQKIFKVMIKLNRPLVFFDLETTGLDFANDRIVQIACIKLNPDKTVQEYSTFINPEGRKMSPEALDKTGIDEEGLKEFPTFSEISNIVFDFISGCDLSGYNITKFDIPMLTEEFLRCDQYFDISEIFIFDSYKIIQIMESRKLEDVYQRLFNEKMTDAHDAMTDTKATARIFNKQLSLYNLPTDPDELSKKTFPDKNDFVDLFGKIKKIDNEYVFAFGKHKDRMIKDVYSIDSGYLDWMLGNKDFTREFKLKLSMILDEITK